MNISNRSPAIQVEYDRHGSRVTKTFTDPYEARRFYVTKLNQGRNPTVKKTSANTDKAKDTATKTEKQESSKQANPKTELAKQPKQEPAKTPESKKLVGVRATPTRPYLAGTIIAKHGLVAGVTEAMVAELDKAFGKPNQSQSEFCLKNAWHAARGFTGEVVE